MSVVLDSAHYVSKTVQFSEILGRDLDSHIIITFLSLSGLFLFTFFPSRFCIFSFLCWLVFALFKNEIVLACEGR